MQPLISNPQFVPQYGQYSSGSVPNFGANYAFPSTQRGFGPGLQAIPSSGPLSLPQGAAPALQNPFLATNPFVTNTPPAGKYIFCFYA